MSQKTLEEIGFLMNFGDEDDLTDEDVLYWLENFKKMGPNCAAVVDEILQKRCSDENIIENVDS